MSRLFETLEDSTDLSLWNLKPYCFCFMLNKGKTFLWAPKLKRRSTIPEWKYEMINPWILVGPKKSNFLIVLLSEWTQWTCVTCGKGMEQKRTRTCNGCQGDVEQHRNHECEEQPACDSKSSNFFQNTRNVNFKGRKFHGQNRIFTPFCDIKRFLKWFWFLKYQDSFAVFWFLERVCFRKISWDFQLIR